MAVSAAGSKSRLLRAPRLPLRRWLRTTPGQLRLAAVVLVVALSVALVGSVAAARARGKAATAVGRHTVPELVAARDLYRSLAAADATQSIIFLQAGLEDPGLRQQYQQEIADAGAYLVALAHEAGSSPRTARAATTISRDLPVYTGYVERARANIRQGFSVGAAYLRRASRLVMRERILPAATALYTDAGDRLDENYRDGTSSAHIALVLASGIAALALLLGVQIFVARRSRRILNVPLVAATLIVFVVIAFTLLRVVSSENSLAHAQRNGSDSVQLLSVSGILALQAQADENLALTERGTGQAFLNDFDSVMNRLGGARGQSDLLAATRGAAKLTGSITDVDVLGRNFVELRRLDRLVRRFDDEGLYTNAVVLATGREPGQQAFVFAAFGKAIENDMARAERVLYADAADARSGFGALGIAIPVLLLLSGGLVIGGLQRRIAEYA